MTQQEFFSLYCQTLEEGLKESSLSNTFINKAKALLNVSSGNVEALRPLISILGQIGEADKTGYFEPGKLDLSEIKVFAKDQKVTINPSNIQSEYKEGAVFLNHYKSNQSSWAYRYTLYHLIHAYGARVSFTDKESEDFSLFDRNRLVAGIFSCLHHASEEETKNPFLLVKGAVSGIQKFIYNDIKAEQIAESKGSSKLLRGRSFYLSLLNQTLSEYIIEELELELSNIIFVGGGQFTLILPNKQALKQKLQGLSQKITLGLRDFASPKLSLILGTLDCTTDDLSVGNISSTYTRLNDKLEMAKQKKAKTFLKDLFAYTDPSKNNVRLFEDAELIGKKAPKAEYLLELTVPLNKHDMVEKLNHLNHFVKLKSLAFCNKFLLLPQREGKDSMNELFHNNADFFLQNDIKCKLIYFNDTNFTEPAEIILKSGIEIAVGFRFVGNEVKKTDTAAVLPFEKIAELSGEDKCLEFPQLAVMRMDIDDLGAIFFKGLGNQTSFQRIACLSRELELFFGGYFNEIAKKNEQYITYSGGDDAFVVGSWKTTLHFAKDLNEAFRKFTCHNSNIGISAGIFMCNPYYPVARFAYDAEELEQQSKRNGKNAITVYEHTLTWEKFDKMMRFTEQLDAVTEAEGSNMAVAEGKKIRRSVVRRFLRIIQAVRDKDDFEYYRNVAMLQTLLARQGLGNKRLHGEESKANDNVASIVKKLLSESKDPEVFKDYTVPIHYVLNSSRERSNLKSKR